MPIHSIITAHNEKTFLPFALKSVLANVDRLPASEKATANVRIMLDRPDDEMLKLVRQLSLSNPLASYEVVDYGDISKVRNHAISNIPSGDFVAFLDADDLWCDTWLEKCIELINKNNSAKESVLHPKLNYYFGEAQTKHSRIVFEHISSLNEEFQLLNLANTNYYAALAFASKDVFAATPYVSSDKKKKIGFEDWTFNIQTLSKGIAHLVVEETVHFIRDKVHGSRRREEANHSLNFHPSTIWAEQALHEA